MPDQHDPASPAPLTPSPATPRSATPGWVKAVLTALAVLLALFVLLHLTGHGFGGPMAHLHG